MEILHRSLKLPPPPLDSGTGRNRKSQGTEIEPRFIMNEEMDPQSEASRPPLLAENISRRILTARGHRVMLDADLAELYDVPTKAFNQAIQRNMDRFPEDFMFQLTEEEFAGLRSQFVTSKKGRGGRRYLPYVFTEQGIAMLSGVLNSHRAVQVNIAIMRAFVRMRRMLVSHEELARTVAALEGKYDSQFRVVFDAIRALMEPPKTSRRRIGF